MSSRQVVCISKFEIYPVSCCWCTYISSTLLLSTFFNIFCWFTSMVKCVAKKFQSFRHFKTLRASSGQSGSGFPLVTLSSPVFVVSVLDIHLIHLWLAWSVVDDGETHYPTQCRCPNNSFFSPILKGVSLLLCQDHLNLKTMDPDVLISQLRLTPSSVMIRPCLGIWTTLKPLICIDFFAWFDPMPSSTLNHKFG